MMLVLVLVGSGMVKTLRDIDHYWGELAELVDTAACDRIDFRDVDAKEGENTNIGSCGAIYSSLHSLCR